MIALGVDPGLENGFAVVDDAGALLLATEIVPIGEGARKRLPLAGLGDLIHTFGVTCAVIEAVAAMPKHGIASDSRFGRATGSIEGALTALQVMITFINPTTWKRVIGVSASKEGARALAIQRWPGQQQLFARKRDHNRAEAALLAVYYLQTQRRAAA